MKDIYLFDIDETFLTRNPHKLNAVKITLSKFNAYKTEGKPCYTINKEKMKSIFKAILENGDEIGFNTKGSLNKSRIKTFFKEEYDIDLGDDFILYNKHIEPQVTNKVNKISFITQKTNVTCRHIVVIDNDKMCIDYANQCGYIGIYADCNASDETNGELCIETLNTMIQKKRQLSPEAKADQFAIQAREAAERAEAAAEDAEIEAEIANDAVESIRLSNLKFGLLTKIGEQLKADDPFGSGCLPRKSF